MTSIERRLLRRIELLEKRVAAFEKEISEPIELKAVIKNDTITLIDLQESDDAIENKCK